MIDLHTRTKNHLFGAHPEAPSGDAKRKFSPPSGDAARRAAGCGWEHFSRSERARALGRLTRTAGTPQTGSQLARGAREGVARLGERRQSAVIRGSCSLDQARERSRAPPLAPTPLAYLVRRRMSRRERRQRRALVGRRHQAPRRCFWCLVQTRLWRLLGTRFSSAPWEEDSQIWQGLKMSNCHGNRPYRGIRQR